MRKNFFIFFVLFLVACSTTQAENEIDDGTELSTSPIVLTATSTIAPGSTHLATQISSLTETIPPFDGVWIEVGPENWETLLDIEHGGIFLIPGGGFYVQLPDDTFGVYQDGELIIHSFEEAGLMQGPFRFFGTPNGAALILGYEELAIFRDGTWEVGPTPPFPDNLMGYWLYVDPLGNYWVRFTYKNNTYELRQFENTTWKEIINIDFSPLSPIWTSEGELWAEFPNDTIGRYVNGIWETYPAAALWESWRGDHQNIRIAVSDAGNVYVMGTYQDSIVKTDQLGGNTEIPLSNSIYVDAYPSNVFTLAGDALWIYCLAKVEFGGEYILAYYVPNSDGIQGEWYLINKPIYRVFQILGLPEGRILINALNGVYVYTPDD